MYQNEYLSHHGVKGQKWGVRRYQNYDGSLTSAGRKRQEKLVGSNKKATIAKGTELYRVSDSNKSDASNDKIYVSATKKSGDFYITALGAGKIYKKGKVYTHTYLAKTDLNLPDKKTMEKIELGLLKDEKVQTELVDSLMKKGMSRENATKQVKAYNMGAAFAGKVRQAVGGAYLGSMAGVYAGLATGTVPISIGAGAAVGAAMTLRSASPERERALTVTRVSYGDKNNKVMNKTLRDELSKRGYNAMKDYNDRRAFGKKGNQAVIVFDSDKNIKKTSISEIKSKDYGEAYARNYLKEHPKSKLNFQDLVKDGEAKYNSFYEEGLIAREREKERQKLLAKAKKKK